MVCRDWKKTDIYVDVGVVEEFFIRHNGKSSIVKTISFVNRYYLHKDVNVIVMEEVSNMEMIFIIAGKCHLQYL